MSAAATTPPDPREPNDDESFAATVAEELFDSDQRDDMVGSDAADDRALHTLPTIGHVGRYALKYRIGEGGLGTVHAALDPLLSRPIAVKTLHVDADSSQREALEAQLLAEARAAAGLNHPNIVTVYDAGLSEAGVYIAMERLQGRDLRHLLADGWRPEPLQAARIARRVADALAYAHSKGVVHCDVKPANIFMVGRAQPKVLDFGIARVAQGQFDVIDIDAAASLPSTEIGSPYYASPEQLRGEPLDPRCDVYGLGVVLYELLAGQRAFGGNTLEAIRHAVLEADVPPAHTRNPAVSAALSGIVARAMARNPARRYRSARQFARALRSLLEDEGTVAAHAPLRSGHWAWGAFAGLGLAAAVGFWVLALEPAGAAAGSGSASSAATAAVTATAALASATMPPSPLSTAPPPAATPLSATPSPVLAATAGAAPTPMSERAPTAAQPVARERRSTSRDAPARTAAGAAAAPSASPGVLQIAVTPWGQVEIDGAAAGTTPPLTRVTLAAGTHQITIRNEDFAPYATTVTVSADKPVTVRHRFGS